MIPKMCGEVHFWETHFRVLSVCTRNNSLNSYRIVMIQHALKRPFSSVSNDMRYILSCATFGNRPSFTQTDHLRRSSHYFPSSTYYHDLSKTQTHWQVLFLSLSSFLKRKVSLSTGVCLRRETGITSRTSKCTQNNCSYCMDILNDRETFQCTNIHMLYLKQYYSPE